MSGRAETRTPEPPDRDERENSPPRLVRPKRTTRPPAHYAQEQEIDTEQRNTRSQRKKKSQDVEMNYTSRSSTKSKKSLALPSQSFDMNYRPWRINPRHRNPTPSHALRTATRRSSAKSNPCALQSILRDPRPMQMSPVLPPPANRAIYGLSHHGTRHRLPSPTRYIAR